METLDCALQRWSPGLGDPNVMGWLTVVVFAAAAIVTARRAIRGPFAEETRSRERAFWWFSSVVLACLAVNKQLDLQTLLTEVGRCVAHAQGWYEDRQIVQRRFIAGVMVGGVVFMGWLGFLLRRTVQQTGLAVLGLGFVCIFVAVRAAGFHHVDTLIGTAVAGLHMNWLLELPGPILVMVAGLRGSLPS
ncbi:isopropylmalate isomerase [Tabrizicola sp. BL-A-41-H6]|uniref:isopropylmalate isomerase n=1 Tax=Tabrizicola sp. BL-A-41-H6 TaxID=3421107 RepID=UPI003D679783